MQKSIGDTLASLHEESRSLWLPKKVAENSHVDEDAIHFLREHVSQSQPCVWRGVADDWPAANWGLHSDFRDLRDVMGDRTIDVTYTPDGRADAIVNLQQAHPSNHDVQRVFATPLIRPVLLDDFMQSLLTPSRSEGFAEIPYCATQNSNFLEVAPELLKNDVYDIDIEFARSAFGAEPTAMNLWIGDSRSMSSMHADPFENLYVVVQGCKTFFLRPPCDSAFLPKPNLPRARWARADGPQADAYVPDRSFEGWALLPEEGHTEWIDESAVSEAFSDCVSVKVRAGDMLYLPALWYHRVHQHGITIAVNWWFDMAYGKDWVYRDLCFNLRKMSHGDAAHTTVEEVLPP